MSDCRFSDTHEWAKREGENAVVGISAHAKSLLGDIVHIELPAVGAVVQQGDAVGVIESVKAASDYYTPLSGVIVAVNEALNGHYEAVNTVPEETWLFKIRLSKPDEWAALLSLEAYRQATHLN